MSNSPRIEKLDNQLVINGDMNYAQRGITSNLSGTVQTSQYLIDRFSWKGDIGGMNSDISQHTENNKKWIRLDVNTSISSGGASDLTWLRHKIEGTFLKDYFNKNLPMKLQFRVKSNIVGKHVGYFYSASSNEILPFSYVIDQADVEEVKTIPFSFSSSHNTDSNSGIQIDFLAYSDSTRLGLTDGVWQTSTGKLSVSPVNILTSGNYVQITEMMVYSASALQGPQEFRLAGRNAFEELYLCQRYYEHEVVGYGYASPNGSASMTYIEKRTTPIVTRFLAFNTSNETGTVVPAVEIKKHRCLLNNPSNTFVGGVFHVDAEL